VPAHAGRSCEDRKLTAQALTLGMGLAERTARALDASGARVVVIARAGQDLSKYNLQYSHLGLAYKTAEGWRVLHKLNTCGTSTADLHLQGLGEFFMDDPYRYEAAFMSFKPQYEEALLSFLRNPGQRSRMHIKPYNMVSYAWGLKYQQSNQWALETIAGSTSSSIRTRNQAQDWLRQYGYVPTTLSIPPLTRLGGRMTQANVAFDDHPNAKRFSDRIETVSVESVFAFLHHAQMTAGPVSVVR
jgi:hypothetical protein